MKSDNRLDRLRVASPCPVSWEQMSGDDRVRFCDLCGLHVYNVAEMNRADAENLFANAEGRVCARLFRRADGKVITRDCPVGLRAFRRRVARIAGAAFATLLSLGGTVAGQKTKAQTSCQEQVKITRRVANPAAQGTKIQGTIRDSNGVMVPGVKIKIFDSATKKTYEWVSNDEGNFGGWGLSAGTYDITIKSPGFQKLERKHVTVGANETVNIDMVLIPDSATVVVGIIVETPLIDTSRPGTTIISGEMIRKLPVP